MMPITFQRTLMPKSGTDQAVITGLSGALNHGFAALIQDTIEAVALQAQRRDLGRRGEGQHLAPGERGGRPGGGRSWELAIQTVYREEPGERLPRESSAPPGGGRHGPVRLDRRPHAGDRRATQAREDRSTPVALPVGIARPP
jgi:hypothetical protein